MQEMADWTLSNKPEVAVCYGMFGVPKMIAEKTDGGDIVPSADILYDKWYKTGAVAPLGSPLCYCLSLDCYIPCHFYIGNYYVCLWTICTCAILGRSL